MTDLLLSPHNDDETLFASYLLQRERPKVIVCLLGSRKAAYPLPAERIAESRAAMEILGCDFEQLYMACDPAQWDIVEMRLRTEPEPGRVWVPTPEPHGHSQHNKLARIANAIWPGRLSYYTTYRCSAHQPYERTTHGHRVEAEAGWDEQKKRALACYETQSSREGTAMHFEQPLDEYELPELRLNLGGGLNPIAGYVNIDKSTGWTFESGLSDYASSSVAAITISHTLMYVSIDEWPMVFAELARVLQPGGTVRVTEDAIGQPGSSRPKRRPGAAVATNAELVLDHLFTAGLVAGRVDADETSFVDETLIQQNYGSPPDVFHVEAVLPATSNSNLLERTAAA